MASGHVNRTNRPNTWLHRPACGSEESPCQPGAVHTWHECDLRLARTNVLSWESNGLNAHVAFRPFMTRSGLRPDWGSAPQHLDSEQFGLPSRTCWPAGDRLRVRRTDYEGGSPRVWHTTA